MGNESKEQKKAETPVLGTEVSADNKGAYIENPEIPESSGMENHENAPQWAIELKETCNAVLTAIGEFNENAANVVKDILAEAKGNPNNEPQKPKQSNTPSIKINKKAKYVVAQGKSFHSSVSGSLVKEGTDISGLENDRLEKLIVLGIAVEKSDKD